MIVILSGAKNLSYNFENEERFFTPLRFVQNDNDDDLQIFSQALHP